MEPLTRTVRPFGRLGPKYAVTGRVVAAYWVGVLLCLSIVGVPPFLYPEEHDKALIIGFLASLFVSTAVIVLTVRHGRKLG
jgi:hypothetical protein